MDQFEHEIERATQRAQRRLTHDPRAIAAHYEAERRLVVVELSTGYALSFTPERAQGLAGAAPPTWPRSR
jgi:hypothetical protein